MTYSKKVKIVLPEDTVITKYFQFKDHIFSKLHLPDNRDLVQIEHTWGDGEIMKFGFEYSDGILRIGINPLHIVRIYDRPVSKKTLEKDLLKFIGRTYGNIYDSPELLKEKEK